MSRSRRQTPICGMTTAASDKRWKQAVNRARRAAWRSLLNPDPEGPPPERPEDYGPKDGKQYFDPAKWPALMRK